MKKLRMFLILCLALAVLAGCSSTPDPTEPPPTTAPTEAPTEAPTDPPTEPPTEPMEPITGYHFAEPEGFVAAASTETLSVMIGPDGDGSSITIMKLNTGVDVNELNEENVGTTLGIFGDEEQQITVNSMEVTEVDGYPAFQMDYNMTTSGVNARYIAYFISDGATTYAFMFADASADGVWADAFAASAATLNMLVEGEVIPVNTTGLELYDLGCGLSMYAAPGMEKYDDEELAAYLADTYTAVMVYEYSKAEYGLYGLSVEDFLSMLVDGEIITGFEQDPYGSIAAGYYDTGADGSQYFYYTVGINTADSFWLVDCACNADMAALYIEDFAQWCATISETA